MVWFSLRWGMPRILRGIYTMSHPYIRRYETNSGLIVTELDIFYSDAKVRVYSDGSAEWIDDTREASIECKNMDADICAETLQHILNALAPTIRKGDKV